MMGWKNCKLLCLICMLFVLLMTGCRGNSAELKEADYPQCSDNQFDARVLEVSEQYLMVEAKENQVIAGEVKVWIGEVSKSEISGIKEGMLVRITHDGKMTMSIPAQISAKFIKSLENY